MDVLERYLRAVKFWLPKSERSDIALELSEDIRSEIEDREKTLGRTLNVEEVRALLRERGNPLLVAERYLPERYVIGPALYPLYALVLRSVMLCYAVPWLCVWLVARVFWPGSHAVTSMGPLFGLWELVQVMAIQFGVITLTFAAVERNNAAAAIVERIVPSEVGTLRKDRHRIPRANSVLEAVFSLAFLSWWLGIARFPALPDTTIAPAPFVAHYLYWPLALLFAAGAAIGIVNALAPEWSPRRALARFCVDVLGIVVLVAVLAAWPFVQVTGSGSEIGMLALNWSLAVTIAIVVLSMAVRAVVDLRRLRGQAAPDNWFVLALAGE
jgi:hypothetical protein